ncbi:MAG: GNAT family N-acetyltransferase [Tenericutes bacterium]|jgi:ribosomal-protein-alanine N-acetyltransferase|nr:GNAT family N-acetyltransferase [Mycoplasmatota bacterium]
MEMFKTKRCLIRSFQEQDVEAFMEYRNDMEWMKYQGFKGLTKEEYMKFLIENNIEEQNIDFSEGKQIAIVETFFNELIGDLYLKTVNDGCFIGYTISPKNAKKGYAFEVVTQLEKWLMTLGVKVVYAEVDKENKASIVLLTKLGFSYLDTNDMNEMKWKKDLY